MRWDEHAERAAKRDAEELSRAAAEARKAVGAALGKVGLLALANARMTRDHERIDEARKKLIEAAMWLADVAT